MQPVISFGLALGLFIAGLAQAQTDGTVLADAFAKEVDKRLDVPSGDQAAYGGMLTAALAGHEVSGAQYVLLVDRNPFVQAAMIYWLSETGEPRFIGASPVSTGKPGRFEYFETPLGLYPHSLDNLDFRALGTKNENGIRGYGIRDRRIFDFGWQPAIRGWGKRGPGTIRLQVHATDPDLLEPRLGATNSKGCIRVPGTFDAFLDKHAILDGDYDKGIAAGKTFYMLLKSRLTTPWSGRYLVIVDSGRTERPAWSPEPKGMK